MTGTGWSSALRSGCNSAGWSGSTESPRSNFDFGTVIFGIAPCWRKFFVNDPGYVSGLGTRRQNVETKCDAAIIDLHPTVMGTAFRLPCLHAAPGPEVDCSCTFRFATQVPTALVFIRQRPVSVSGTAALVDMTCSNAPLGW